MDYEGREIMTEDRSGKKKGTGKKEVRVRRYARRRPEARKEEQEVEVRTTKPSGIDDEE